VVQQFTGEQTAISDDSGLTSFSEWYQQEHARLSATVVLVTGDVDSAADAVAEAFARALERWARVSVMSSPAGWTYRVALNFARRTARRSAMEHRLLARAPKPCDVPAPAGELWGLVATLSRRQREVVVLRYIADFHENEIADVLGVSRSTVSSTLADAHRRLGALLDEEEVDNGV
jgi:RNA polymerase sigma-70 factor (ECF subfamily)